MIFNIYVYTKEGPVHICKYRNIKRKDIYIYANIQMYIYIYMYLYIYE